MTHAVEIGFLKQSGFSPIQTGNEEGRGGGGGWEEGLPIATLNVTNFFLSAGAIAKQPNLVTFSKFIWQQWPTFEIKILIISEKQCYNYNKNLPRILFT